jgi:hypothetical protein
VLNVISHQGNSNKNHKETLLHTNLDGHLKKKNQNNMCWQNCTQIGTLIHWEECKMVHPLLKNNLTVSLNIKQNYHMQFTILLYVYVQVKTHIHIKTCTGMFISALLRIAKKWKPQCPSADEWSIYRESRLWVACAERWE